MSKTHRTLGRRADNYFHYGRNSSKPISILLLMASGDIHTTRSYFRYEKKCTYYDRIVGTLCLVQTPLDFGNFRSPEPQPRKRNKKSTGYTVSIHILVYRWIFSAAWNQRCMRYGVVSRNFGTSVCAHPASVTPNGNHGSKSRLSRTHLTSVPPLPVENPCLFELLNQPS